MPPDSRGQQPRSSGLSARLAGAGRPALIAAVLCLAPGLALSGESGAAPTVAHLPTPGLVRIQLGGYVDRVDAERDSRRLDAAGIEWQIVRLDAEAGFAINAGVFRWPENVEAMEQRLRALGFVNVHQVALGPRTHLANAAPAVVRGEGLSQPQTSPAIETAPPSPIEQAASTGLQPVSTGQHPAGPSPTLHAVTYESDRDAEPRGFSGAKPSNTPFSGFYQNETSYAFRDPDHWQKFRHRLFLSADGEFNPSVAWKLSAWGTYDPIFDITSFYLGEVRDDRQAEAMLRETYLDIGAGDWQFRLGRQQIIWGEMVGLFFADVVSAKDLREFVARDFELIRIPQWAARAEYFAGDLHAEAVWIPYVTYDDIGVPQDDFYPFNPPPIPGYAAEIGPSITPANALDNGSYGLRMSYLHGGWDLAGFYFRGYDLSPVFARELRLEPEPVAVFTPEHRRMHQVGLTAARDLGPAVLKGEMVYNRDRWFNVVRLDASDGLVQQDFLDYIVGLDTVFAGDTQLNLQFFQRRFFDHDADIIQDRVESGASVYLSGWLGDARLRPEFLLVHSLDRSDWMTRPSVTWEPPGDWRVTVGADLFGGPAEGLFGRFDNSDRVYTEVRWDF